jgi:predicted ArsR family transcriptional regulator
MMVEELSALDASEVGARDGQQILKLVFERLADGLSAPLVEELTDKDLGQRLDTLISHLEKSEFYPETDCVDGNLRIQLHNCPFRSVALLNTAVCAFDSSLISSLLGRGVERVSCIGDGDDGCVYAVGLADEDAERLINVTTA